MTDERMALIDLIEKSADSDLVREMLSFAAERLMEPEVEAHTGAAHGQVQRNGYRERAWGTRAGRIDLEIPRYAKAATSHPSSSHGARQRRRSPPSSKKPTCMASRPGPWTTWSKPWGRQVSPNAFLARPLEGKWPYSGLMQLM
jgi:hypothetical protein